MVSQSFGSRVIWTSKTQSVGKISSTVSFLLALFDFLDACIGADTASTDPISPNASLAIRRTYASLFCNSCLKAGTASFAPSPIELNANTTLTRTNLLALLSCNSCLRAGTASTAPSPIALNANAAFERTLESSFCNSLISLSTFCSWVSSAYAINPNRQTNKMQLIDFIIFIPLQSSDLFHF